MTYKYLFLFFLTLSLLFGCTKPQIEVVAVDDPPGFLWENPSNGPVNVEHFLEKQNFSRIATGVYETEMTDEKFGKLFGFQFDKMRMLSSGSLLEHPEDEVGVKYVSGMDTDWFVVATVLTVKENEDSPDYSPARFEKILRVSFRKKTEISAQNFSSEPMIPSGITVDDPGHLRIFKDESENEFHIDETEFANELIP